MTHLGLALSAGAQHSGSDADMQSYAQSMLQGIRKYQMHPFERPDPERPCFWQVGEVRLLHIAPSDGKAHNDPVLVIPSMVNKAYILDLLSGLSFCQWLADAGHDVYLLDWGTSLQDAGQADMDALFTQRLVPALEAVSANGPVHVMGYCMGGTLATALTVLKPDKVRSLCLLAAPWDFKGGGGDLSKWVQFWTPTGLSLIAQQGHLPSDWIQTVFASLDPFHTAQKFTDFAAMDDSGAKAQIFVAVEDWLNDALALPGGLAQECLNGWFMQNKPFSGTWGVCGQTIDPQKIKAPVLIVASENDRLVPYSSSMAFQEQCGSANIVQATCGHIGFMASQKAQGTVWPHIAKFFAGAA